MKPLINHPVKVFVTGFIALLFLSLSLFWIRFACETYLTVNNMADSVRIEPSGIVPTELENDPKVTQHSLASARIGPEEPIFLGILDYFIARLPGGRLSNVYFTEDDDEWLYFDKKTGQLVYRYQKIQRMPDKTRLTINVELYIGPEGIATVPNKTLGRFIEPIIDLNEIYQFRQQILYDKKLRQFFKIDCNKQTVVKGTKLGKDDSHKPIQIGRLKKNTFGSPIVHWQPPKVPDIDGDVNTTRSIVEHKPIIPTDYNYHAGLYLLVLDKTGRIDLLDKETLEFAGYAGWLPTPKTYFGTTQSARPKNLLSYEVRPLVLNKFYLEDGRLYKTIFGGLIGHQRVAYTVDRKYLGMSAASVSRDGNALALSVFDENGKQINTQYNAYIPSSTAAFWGVPWAPVATIGKFLTENLHPPILSLASYFTASTFEAGSGHRALFILPNSFIAMVGRDLRGNFAERFFSALWFISPSIILAIFLAWRLDKDAKIIGLTKRAKLSWIIGTIAFGLTAYITYRLTKPKITLVTCQNCGKPRRPDMEKCHRCKSHWYVPELTPPAWRVVE